MAWEALNFSSGNILTAAEMNQLQTNFTALAQQQSGAPKIDVSCAAADLFDAQTMVTTDFRTYTGSFQILNATSANIDNLQTDLLTVSGFQADIFSANILGVGSGTFDNLISSDALIGIGSFSVLHANSGKILSLQTTSLNAASIVTGFFEANTGQIQSLEADDIFNHSIIGSDFQFDTGSINILHANSITTINLQVESETNLVKRDEWLQNGFLDKTQSTISFSDTNRVFTINRTGTEFEYFVEGIKYTVTSDDQTGYNTVTLGDSEGLHAIYYDTSTLTSFLNPSGDEFKDLIITKALASLVYYNTSSSQGILYDERHGENMAPTTHSYLHQVVGFTYISGLALGDFVIGNGSLNSHAQFSIASGVCFDEDLGIDLNAIDSTTATKVFYRDGTDWRWRTQTGFKCITFDGTSATRLAYDDSGTLTEVGNGNYVLIHIFASNAADGDSITILGQAEYNNLNDAQAGADTEINNLVLSGLPTKELKPIGSVIFETKNTFTNDVQARVVQTSTDENYVDWRTTRIAAGVAAVEHSSLGGLTDGDAGHTQFALLAGRDGGQTLIGGIQSGDILTLQSCDGVTINNLLVDDMVVESSFQTNDLFANVACIDLLNVNTGNFQTLISSAFWGAFIDTQSANINYLNTSNFLSNIISSSLIYNNSAAVDYLTASNAQIGVLTISGGLFSNLVGTNLEATYSNVACLFVSQLAKISSTSYLTVQGTSTFDKSLTVTSAGGQNNVYIDNGLLFCELNGVHEIAFTTPGGETGIAFNASEKANRSRFNFRNYSNPTTDDRYFSFDFTTNARFDIRYNGRMFLVGPYGRTIAGATTFYINSSGELGTVSSLRKAKTNIVPLSTCDQNWLDNIEWIKFNYRKINEDGSYSDEPEPYLEFGAIAEDIEALNSDFVFYKNVVTGQNSEGEDINNSELRGINYHKFIPAIGQRQQVIKSEVNSLKAMNNSAMASITSLVAQNNSLSAAIMSLNNAVFN